jgi:REP element-mobilizing transposase RayT
MKSVKVFGGSLMAGKRKSARPLCTKRTINVVLKAKDFGLARGQKLIKSEILKAAKKWGVKIYRISVLIDHVHLLIQIPTRMAYRFFIQRVCGAISLKLGVQWLFRPFTRIVEWGRDFKRTCGYVEMNELEAWGYIPYQPRGRNAMHLRAESYPPP